MTNIELIKSYAPSDACVDVLNAFIDQYPQFDNWSGSSWPTCHHYGDGGLMKHTKETINIGLTCRHLTGKQEKIDPVEYYLAALFHDAGKMYDYVKTPAGSWTSTIHKKHIYHLSRSAIIWHDIIQKFPELNVKYHDLVYHAILAHHGQKEWGSPVTPKTHVAWLLHLSDNMSARMDDADKIEYDK